MDENKDQDRQLFSQIAIDVREHPNKYRNAGEWLDKYWGEKRQVPQLVRFNEARQDLLKNYKEQDFISEDDTRCIILITWLLTDPDAEKPKFNITEFAKWSWEPTDNILSQSRCAESRLWRQNAHVYSSWMRLVRIAWKTLETEKEIPTEQNSTPTRSARIGTWLWKLYEKTLKVIVDAILDRLWPK